MRTSKKHSSSLCRLRRRDQQIAPPGYTLLELNVALVLLGLALAGLGPLVVMQQKQLKQLESRFDDQTTYYLVPTTANGATLPATYRWSRKLGIPASIQDDDSNATPTQPFEAHVNFQVPGDPPPGVVSGFEFLADAGRRYDDRGNGYVYGWNADNTANMRNRDSSRSPDERYDTLAHMQVSGTFRWDIAVPNGTYSVHIVAGDPNYIDSNYRIQAESIRVVNGVPTSGNRWFEGTRTIVVSDGRLTVSNASGSSNNKINFIDITTAPPLKLVRILSVEKSPISEQVTAHVTVR